MLKRLFLDIKKTIYILFAICLFSIIGSIIIHIYPEGYFKIHIYPLFKWLIEHKRWDTFWIYIITLLFLYIGIVTFYCLSNDIKRKNILTGLMHISVIIFLLAHLISALYTFRINDQILIENSPSKILIKEHKKELNLNVKRVNYEITQFGVPINIKGTIELPGQIIKEISVNKPAKIDDYHIILKDLTGFLSEIELSIEKMGEIEKISFQPNIPTKFHNFYLTILDISDDFSTLKLKIDDGKNTSISFIKIGEYLTINNEKFLINNTKPTFQTAIVVDIVYDPSITIILIASSIFTITLAIQFILRLKKIFN